MSGPKNIDRFKDDIKRLLRDAAKLEMSLNIDAFGKDMVKQALKGKVSDDDIEAAPIFSVAYESWYTESLALIKQLIPDRLHDFKEHFEIQKGRKEITFASYRIQDALKGLTMRLRGEVVVDSRAAVPHFRQQSAILKAAEKRFESSLFEIRQLVLADLFDSEIAAARELAKNKFLRAAGAIAGVVLEKHLRQVCEDRSISVHKKNPTINDLNELLKSNSVVDIPQWRFISMLGDIRNLCDHNKQTEPTQQQVADLIDGTDKVLKTVF